MINVCLLCSIGFVVFYWQMLWTIANKHLSQKLSEFVRSSSIEGDEESGNSEEGCDVDVLSCLPLPSAELFALLLMYLTW